VIDAISKLVRAQRQLEQELRREPTPGELARKIEVSVSAVRKILRVAGEPISLETPVGDDGESRLSDLLVDTGGSLAHPVGDQGKPSEQMANFSKRSVRGGTDLEDALWIAGDQVATLEQVGPAIWLDTRANPAIETKSLRKLSAPAAAAT